MSTTPTIDLPAIRDRARAELSTLELPAFRGVPGWEFTEIPELDLDSYATVDAGAGDAAAVLEAAPRVFDHLPEGTIRLSQVDHDTVVADESGVEGVTVLPLEVAIDRVPHLVAPYLGEVETARTPFTARNDDHWRGGFFVHVARNVQLSAPVLLTLVQHAAGRTVSPRVLIAVEEGAKAEVWAQTVSSDPEIDGLVNGVVELSVGQNAQLRFVDVQELAETSWVFGNQRATVGRDAHLDWVTFGFGAKKGKVFLETSLDGEGAHGVVTGGYASRGRQHVDFDTLQTHAAANTTSDLAFRGLVGDRSHAVWRGMIKVDEGAQQTDAFQESRNLLLTRKAHADAIPGLEIAANDVRCTHAAAIAQIDPEQVFYLRSHGLPLARARRLVIEGFLAELVARFEEGPMRDALAELLEARLALVLGA